MFLRAFLLATAFLMQIIDLRKNLVVNNQWKQNFNTYLLVRQMRKKDRRFDLEGDIITLIYEDNRNTVHFDYHVDIDDVDYSIMLDLYTRNARNGAIFLLHQTRGTSSVDVLQKMLSYLKSNHLAEEKYSFTVKWIDRNEESKTEQVSYFYDASEDDVRKKFFYNKREEDYLISIERNPLS